MAISQCFTWDGVRENSLKGGLRVRQWAQQLRQGSRVMVLVWLDDFGCDLDEKSSTLCPSR
jgi:hypothetical protein